MHAASHAGRQILRHIARVAMIERGLQPEFPAAAMRQVAAIGAPAQPSGDAPVRDLRELPWVSIDNDDSRDLDQISAAETLPDGNVRVWVGIADVDALVAPGSPIDAHARHNTTSVYTPARVFPMLPERLSTNLTSLGEHQERLAIVAELTVEADGRVSGSDLYRARVRNHAKLAYPALAAWLDGTARAPAALADPQLQRQLHLQDTAAQSLRGLRHVRGALTLETLQTQAVFDGETLRDLVPLKKNRAEELIEDLMIAANEAVAYFLDRHGVASLRRVLRTPRRWDRIVALAAEFEETLPSTPDALALNTFLARRRRADAQRFADLSLSVVKSLGSGEYLAQAPGAGRTEHFGLAVGHYTHSTAPNRRFPDLISQRLVKSVLQSGPCPYPLEQLTEIATHCTEQENNAAKVERRVAKSAAALLLSGRIGESFDALVTGAASKGTWVRILRPAVEGRLVHGSEGLDIGHRLRVRLLRVDVERGYIDFESV